MPTDLDRTQVRLLIPDNPNDEDQRVFSNEEIDAFLALEPNVWLAAAEAIVVIARSEALLYKHIEVMDVIVDAVSFAKEMRYQADELRKKGSSKQGWHSSGFDSRSRAS